MRPEDFRTFSPSEISDGFLSGARFYTALDNCMQRTDQLEVELQRDIESARMFRSVEAVEAVGVSRIMADITAGY